MVSASEETDESEALVPGVTDAGAVSERAGADDVVTPTGLEMAVSDATSEELSALEVSVAELLIWVSDAIRELDEGTSLTEDVEETTAEEVDGFAEVVDSTFGLEVVVGSGAFEVDVSLGATLEVFSVVLGVAAAEVCLAVVFFCVVFFFRASKLARSSISIARGIGSG